MPVSPALMSADLRRSKSSADFGLIGLAVMGQNLIMNVADHGFTVVVFNRTVAKVDRFLANEAKGTSPFRAVSKVEWLDELIRLNRK